MTLRMQIQTAAFGSFTDVDLAAEGCGKFKLTRSYSHPAILSWVMHRAQHTTPIALRSFVRFWDDAGTSPLGGAFSASNALFEGYVEEIQPAESNLLQYVAYDSSYRSGKEITIMSTAWPQGTVDTDPPVPDATAVPRLIFNSKIDNDDDYAFQRGGGSLTVGNMVATILEDEYHPLYWANAAPGDGTSAGNGVAYLSSELNSLTYVPQEKQVFQSETLRSAFDRLVGSHYPQRRQQWFPISSDSNYSRKWRFPDLTAATERTVTLNQINGSNDVLSMELHRSIDRRATAVKFVGPETLTITVASTQDGSLVPIGYPTVLESFGVQYDITTYQSWQVTNPNRRRMGRLLPTRVLAPVGSYNWIVTRAPTLQCSWDNGSTWLTISGAYFDYHDGIASIAPGYVYFYTSAGVVTNNGTQHYFPPNQFRMVYAYYDVPLSVRYPSSGFSGTAYSVANIAYEEEIYDEMLAIGYERGTPVTSAIRLAQFSTLAQQLHTERKDIIYAGGMTFEGIEYDWCFLDRKLHIDGVDGDGADVTTGWEALGAAVTDVEYDFDQRLTTIQFNADQMELMGVDVEEMKQRLGIRALERRSRPWYRLLFGPFYTWYGNRVNQIIGIQTGEDIYYVDPETGEVHRPL